MTFSTPSGHTCCDLRSLGCHVQCSNNPTNLYFIPSFSCPGYWASIHYSASVAKSNIRGLDCITDEQSNNIGCEAVKMQLCHENAKRCDCKHGDIEIYDFMRAGERRIYYFAYEVSIYSEKIDFQENVNKKMTACSWYLLE